MSIKSGSTKVSTRTSKGGLADEEEDKEDARLADEEEDKEDAKSVINSEEVKGDRVIYEW